MACHTCKYRPGQRAALMTAARLSSTDVAQSNRQRDSFSHRKNEPYPPKNVLCLFWSCQDSGKSTIHTNQASVSKAPTHKLIHGPTHTSFDVAPPTRLLTPTSLYPPYACAQLLPTATHAASFHL